MVKILREADAGSVSEAAKKHGISDQTIYLWRKRFGKLQPADVKRLRHLDHENERLKKLVAERDLRFIGRKWTSSVDGAPPSDELARCCPFRARRWAICRAWPVRTRRFWRRCASWRSEESQQVRCISDYSKPLEVQTPRDYKFSNNQWREVAYRLGPETCEITAPIAPDQSLLLYVVLDCEKDYFVRSPDGQGHPRFSHLVIDGAGIHREWHGWEVSRQFRCTRGVACVLAIREN